MRRNDSEHTLDARGSSRKTDPPEAALTLPKQPRKHAARPKHAGACVYVLTKYVRTYTCTCTCKCAHMRSCTCMVMKRAQKARQELSMPGSGTGKRGDSENEQERVQNSNASRVRRPTEQHEALQHAARDLGVWPSRRKPQPVDRQVEAIAQGNSDGP